MFVFPPGIPLALREVRGREIGRGFRSWTTAGTEFMHVREFDLELELILIFLRLFRYFVSKMLT